MPTVPGPSRSAFGAGLAQAQFGAVQSQLNFANTLSSIGNSINQANDKAKFREDAVTLSSIRRDTKLEGREKLRQWLDNGPTTKADVEMFREDLGKMLQEKIGPKRFNFPDSKVRLMEQLGEIASTLELEAQSAAEQGGRQVILDEFDDSMSRWADQVAENPGSYQDVIAAIERASVSELSGLGDNLAQEAKNRGITMIAGRAMETLQLSGNMAGIEAIMDDPVVRDAMTDEQRFRALTSVDTAKAKITARGHQAILDMATLDYKKAQTAHEKLKAQGQAIDNRVAAFKQQLAEGGREPNPEELAQLTKMQAEAASAIEAVDQSRYDTELKRLDVLSTTVEVNNILKTGGENAQRLNDKASNWLSANQSNIDQEGKMPPGKVSEALNIAVSIMQGTKGPNNTLGTAPAQFVGLLEANGINLQQYARDPGYAARVSQQLFGATQDERFKAENMGHNIAGVDAQAAAAATTEQPSDAPPPLLALPATGPASVSPDTSGPTPGQGADGVGAATTGPGASVDSVTLTPTLEGSTAAPAAVAGAGAGAAVPEGTVEPPENLKPANRAFVAEMAEEEPTPEKADKVINSVVSKNMQLYNNVDVAYGFWNSAKANLFKFAPTSGVVGDQTARVQAREFLRGGLRQLIASVDHIGRFTDDYRKYLTQQFEYLQTSFWDNPDAIRGVMESMSMVLARQYAEHYKAQQLALEGSASTTTATSAESGERMRAVKNMLKVIGAPVLIGRDFLPGEDSGNMDVSTMEEFEGIAEYLYDIKLVEPGDKVKFGGRVYNVGLRPDEEGT